MAKRKGKAARQLTGGNKETVTVMMTWDASGWNYGVQLVVKRKWATGDMLIECPPGECTFDDRVDVTRLQTRSCLPVHSAEGMQTEETFLHYIHRLDEWISQRSAVEAATGGEPIQRPVVLMLDNHCSRFSDELLRKTSGPAAELGIRIFTEESGTSGFLQALDQFNSSFHRSYNKARDAYKDAHLAVHGHPLSHLALADFLGILGGSKRLGVPGMWFSWCDRYDIIKAWKRVGIAGNRLCPQLVDRSNFVDQDAELAAARRDASVSSPGPSSLAEAKRTPPGLRRGSLAAANAKLQQLEQFAKKLEEKAQAPYDPSRGVLSLSSDAPSARQGGTGSDDDSDAADGDSASPVRARRRLVQLSGSFTLRDMWGEKQKRQQEAAKVEDAAQRKKAARLEKRAEDEERSRVRRDAFVACKDVCMCAIVPCPWEGFMLCDNCGNLKKGWCKKRECVKWRKSPVSLASALVVGLESCVWASGATCDVGA